MKSEAERVLGVEGGGTKTEWVLLERTGANFATIAEGRLPAANFRLTSRERLRAILRELPQAARAGVFLAGCVTAEDRRELAALCADLWPNARVVAGSDRDSGFAAAFAGADGIAVNAGTGSSVTGRREGRTENAGGWGHILGDAGGGYYLSLQALRLVLLAFDLRRQNTELTQEILSALCLNSLDDLVRWAQTADKMQIATLAPVVFAAAENGDAEVMEILRAGARVLAEYTEAVARRLDFGAAPVHLLGGLFTGHEIYAAAVRRELASLLPDAVVTVSGRSAAFGAAMLAIEKYEPTDANGLPALAPTIACNDLADAVTEQRNERSRQLDKLPATEFVELFINEESCVQEALRACTPELARALEIVAGSLQNGGRLFHVGAGTSGRLGVLDASEIPPTFGVAPHVVQGIIAGGAAALHRSVEGAEDDPGLGALAVEERGVSARDVVCGIAASGRTPFVLGALARAQEIGARTILLTCNPRRDRTAMRWDVEIDLPTGPELLTGSTRLKAGTATKIALNILTTGAMVRLGKVRENLMIDLQATNAKLRDRAARLVVALTGCSYEAARQRLEANGWNVRAALAAADRNEPCD